ncbi:hypothetical protein [Melissospora conviva]|uniref:hypothetical protein n=1 Tax=Melissospora conviva TaxID=3388432 RepID=UPI003C206D8F
MSELSVHQECPLVAKLAEQRDELVNAVRRVVGDTGLREHLLAELAGVEARLERMRADFVGRQTAALAGVVAARSAAVADRIGVVVSGCESENHTPNL